MIEKMAFKATQNYHQKQLMEQLEALGGQIGCRANREVLNYDL